MKIITKSEKETFDLARNFAKKLKGGEIIGLVGNLGAGKTVFTRGIAAGLGIKDNVNSPTFVLMKIYNIKKKNSKVKRLIHVDAYRLKKTDDISNLGISELLSKENILIIEWPRNINTPLDKTIFLKAIGEEKREIIL